MQLGACRGGLLLKSRSKRPRLHSLRGQTHAPRRALTSFFSNGHARITYHHSLSTILSKDHIAFIDMTSSAIKCF
jgi:hypothetical protein